MKKKWIYIIGAILVIALFGKIVGKKEPKTEVPATKTETVKSQSPAIAGSNPVDIYMNLEKKGFKIDKQFSKDFKLFTCDKSEAGIDYNVTIASTEVDNIEQVKASANIDGSEPSKQIIAAKPFIEFISTVPYTGSDSEKIKKWVDENFNNDKATTTIGDAKFSIYAPTKFARLLVIQKAS